MEDDVYLTQEGYEKLSKELADFKGPKRRMISQAIEHARQLGDISENAEYDSAKDAQALNEKRISDLADLLSRARIIEHSNMPADEVRIGVRVKLKDLEFKDEFEYTLVGEAEADFDTGKISISSPVGRALLGRKVGDEVDVKAPARLLRYKILNIGR
jgi:transcription elongation factor GreA